MSDPAAAPSHSRCQNCGTELRGHFCHECGQQDFEFHRSFGHVFLEALENFAHFDAKFFRNIITLLFRPGQLSADFNAGKRASQMPPFRLYLFISVLFFFIRLLASGPPGANTDLWIPDSQEARVDLTQSLQDLANETTDPAAKQRLQATVDKLRDPALKNAALTDAELHEIPAALAKKIRRELAAEEARHKSAAGTGAEPEMNVTVNKKTDTALNRYLSEKGEYAAGHEREIKEAFLHALPKMLLFCLPFFALYTRVLFRHSGQVYLQHLIIALHYHTFVFLWWPVARGWNELLGLGSPGLASLLSFGTGLWMFLYPFIMLRRVFGQSWLRTSLKALVLTGVYALTLAFGFLLTAVVVFLTI